ncbi:glyoxylase-like metal-dependent hydrolase (beta-lactamase superfamily II) [Nitrobacteraceae bacterium AZCC 1564]
MHQNQAAPHSNDAQRRAAPVGDFHRFRHGEFDITVLSDGYITVPIDIVVPDGTPDERLNVLTATGNPTTRDVTSKTNVPLLRKGNDLILIDIGAGNKYQSSDGRLPANMEIAGIDPATITKIALTHGHPDHMWAMLRDDGGLRFPNATYYISASEWDYWMDPDYQSNMPDILHEFARGTQRDFSAIKERAVMVKPGDDVISGLRVLDTAGHTPGHISFEVAGGEGLIITGDAATNEIASFHSPEARFGYDARPGLAIKNRVRLMQRAASERIKLLGYHWTYPGVGYAEPYGSGYRYIST